MPSFRTPSEVYGAYPSNKSRGPGTMKLFSLFGETDCSGDTFRFGKIALSVLTCMFGDG